MLKLPEKTIERLSIYRKVLLAELANDRHYIFSHELASLVHLKPVQIRSDFMFIGHSSTSKKGYVISKLVDDISAIIDPDESLKIALIGLGNLGKAILRYVNGKRNKLSITVAFDTNEEKIGKLHAGIPCFHIDKMHEIVQKEGITVAIITVPPDHTKKVAENLILAGIKGILNYTATRINVAPYAYLEEYDMITSIEKVAFFSEILRKHPSDESSLLT